MSTYSTTLRLELIGAGQQDGTWGDTTNTNLGDLIEAAITNMVDITFANATYTLSANNGLPDEARAAVLNLIGTNVSAQNLIAPAVQKTYIVKNATGATVTIKTSGGSGVAVANGTTRIVWCDDTDFYTAASQTVIATTAPVNNSVSGDTVTITLDNSGVNAASYTAANITVDAKGRITTASSNTLGTIASQNANAVTITGGTITGITDLAVADGGTGSSSLTANNVLLGNGTSALQTVAPGTSGNVLKSNGTTWVSGAGFTWNTTYVSSSYSAGSSYSLPSNCIGVYVWCTVYGGGNNGGIGKADIKDSGGSTLGTVYINGTNIGGGADGGSGMTDGAGSFIPVSSTATSLYFDVINNGVGGNFTVQAYVTSA